MPRGAPSSGRRPKAPDSGVVFRPLVRRPSASGTRPPPSWAIRPLPPSTPPGACLRGSGPRCRRTATLGPAPCPGTQQHVPGFAAPPFARLAARGDAGDGGGAHTGVLGSRSPSAKAGPVAGAATLGQAGRRPGLMVDEEVAAPVAPRATTAARSI